MPRGCSVGGARMLPKPPGDRRRFLEKPRCRTARLMFDLRDPILDHHWGSFVVYRPTLLLLAAVVLAGCRVPPPTAMPPAAAPTVAPISGSGAAFAAPVPME